MDALDSSHPDGHELHEYSSGRLDGGRSATVEAHLDVCPDCQDRASRASIGSLLFRIREAIQPPTVDDQPAPPADSALSLLKPQAKLSPVIPPGLTDHPDYEVKAELGRGGMGVVYLAHNRMMDRDEVLKVVGRHIMDRPVALERFQREIRAVARLCHPNIVSAYSVTRVEGGLVLSMEYIEGVDLGKLVKVKGPLPVTLAANYVHQAALGLQHAHEMGMIHRDIKPHNMMLTRAGRSDVVKILDFGLAKFMEVRVEAGANGLTLDREAMGTPEYMAPEQIISAADVDIRADIYALGCTLHYLLLGHSPFGGGETSAVLAAHLYRTAEPIDLNRHDVPAGLAAVAARMMAREKDQRYQTPEEVAEALKPFFLPEAVDAQTGPPLDGAITLLPTLADDILPPNGPETLGPAIDKPTPSTDFGGVPIEDGPASDGRSRRAIVLGAIATIGLALLVALAGVLRVRTADGVIVLENLPDDAEVLVDRQKMTIIRLGDARPVEVRALPGEHLLEVERDGTTFYGEKVVFRAKGGEAITLRLERKPEAAHTAVASKGIGSVEPAARDPARLRSELDEAFPGPFNPLFDGKTFAGWTIPSGQRKDWTIKDGSIHVLSTTPEFECLLATERADFADFHLAFEVKKKNLRIGTIYLRTDISPETITSNNYSCYRFYIGGLDSGNRSYLLGLYNLTPKGTRQIAKSGLESIRAPNLPGMSLNEWHRVEVIAKGTRFRMLVDGQEVSAFDDTFARLERGRIALRLAQKASLEIRKIEIKEPAPSALSVASAIKDAKATEDIRTAENRLKRPDSGPSIPRSELEDLFPGPFVPLFDGKGFSGWNFPNGHEEEFSIEGGTIRIDGSGQGANIATTRRDLGDFLLRMDLRKRNERNAVIMVRSTRWTDGGGYEFHLGGLYGNARSGLGDFFYEAPGKGRSTLKNGLVELMKPRGEDLALDVWHRVEVVAIGNRFRLLVDGRAVSAFEAQGPRIDRGQIAIRFPKGTLLDIRSIEIKEPADAGMATTGPAAGAAPHR